MVNRCVNTQGKLYFDLPGGGQNQFETLEEALVREVLEETGYTIKAGPLVAVAEEICDNEALRQTYFDYTHRLLHIFLAGLVDAPRRSVQEPDWQQQGSVWIPVGQADALNFRPGNLTGKISSLLTGAGVHYLGCARFVEL